MSRSRLFPASSLEKSPEEETTQQPYQEELSSEYRLLIFRVSAAQPAIKSFILITLLFAVLQQNDGAASRVQERLLETSKRFSPPAVILAWVGL